MGGSTDCLVAMDVNKKVVPYGNGTYWQFSHEDLKYVGDPTGIFVEEGELLYGLVRAMKPKSILETGTNVGVSTSYMALGLRDNLKYGVGAAPIRTIEHNTDVAAMAVKKLGDMDLLQFVNVIAGGVDDFLDAMMRNPGQYGAPYDLVWLDTELNHRYGEFVKVFPHVSPGGLICIHDLWELDNKEFGGLPLQVKEWLCKGDVRVMPLNTGHGVTIFQKRSAVDYASQLQEGMVCK